MAEWQRILRGLATFEMSLALGNPAVFPQSPVTVQGFKPEIDATEWLSVKVTHSLGGNGFTTRVEFETKTEAVEAERGDARVRSAIRTRTEALDIVNANSAEKT